MGDHSEITAKSQQNHSEITAKSQQNHSKITAKSQQNHSKITAKSEQKVLIEGTKSPKCIFIINFWALARKNIDLIESGKYKCSRL
jgi:hypothetical protein